MPRSVHMEYQLPGQNPLVIKTIILDLNGTLSVAGAIPQGVAPRLEQLKEKGFKLVLFTGNTRGDAEIIASSLGIEWKLAKNGEDKKNLALELNPQTCAAIGNGRIDLELIKTVALPIVTLQAEGVYGETLQAAKIVVPAITDALDLFLEEERIIATLRM
jgi:soluble P-type ATPase